MAIKMLAKQPAQVAKVLHRRHNLNVRTSVFA